MEASKLISPVIAKFKIAYPYYFKDLTKEELLGLVGMYQENLAGYNELTLTNAVNSIVRKSKFMPSIKEMIDECENVRTYKTNLVIERMKSAGYFKDSKEIEKTYHFLEEGIIPEWLLIDMKKYGYQEEKQLTYQSDYKLLDIKD